VEVRECEIGAGFHQLGVGGQGAVLGDDDRIRRFETRTVDEIVRQPEVGETKYSAANAGRVSITSPRIAGQIASKQCETKVLIEPGLGLWASARWIEVCKGRNVAARDGSAG
jgi:hypothetical protein